MAFDGHQTTFGSSIFPAYQHQASVNKGGGNTGSVAMPFSVSLQEQNTASYIPWTHNAHDDPYGFICGTQDSNKSSTDCDGETDLQGLVSNILDEADSQGSYYSEGSLPTFNPVWSPKILSGDLLQYFKSEAKTQHNSTFSSNHVSREALSKAQGQSVDKDVDELYQQSNGLPTNQQWLFHLFNGDRDSYNIRPKKLPPGLPVPKTGNTNFSQVQQSIYDHMQVVKDRGNSQLFNNLPDLSNVFRSHSEMSSSCFHPCYEDQYTQSSTKSHSNEQYGPQEINQLVSSFQSFMAGEHDSLCRGDFPNTHKQTGGMQHEDSMVEQWKITSPAMSTQSTPAMQTPKQLLGEYGVVQMERNGRVSKQTFNRDAFQDLPGFSSQNTEYFQPRKQFSASLNLPNQYQSNMTMHRENTSLPNNMNQYSRQHIQQGLMQSKLRPQLQREKKRVHMSGFPGDGFTTRALANNNMRGGDKKQALTQNPNFDHQGSVQSQRFDVDTSAVCVGNTQQLVPFLYPANDPRRYPNVPINPSNFSSRSTLPYGSGVPGMDVGDMMSASESAAFNSYVSDMVTCRGENTYHGMAPALTTSMVMNQGEPVIQLYFYLDECYEQWRCLERERKKTEVILTKTFLGKRTAVVSNTNLPKTPPNPTRVDHLIVNQMREQSRVASLLDRMERLCSTPLHINIHTALNTHHMAVCITQARRKEEIASMSKQQRQRAHFTEDKESLLLVIALKDLAATTRKLRTALWCALQMTLPKPDKRQDHHVNEEATHTESDSSPFEGYSFKL